MAEPGIVVEGDEQLVRSLNALAGDLGDLADPHRKAGDLLLARADAKTPRQSGRLAASGRVDAASDETEVVYTEVYAGVIHNGWPDRNITPQPWLAETLGEQTTAVGDVFEDYLEDVVGRVRGA